MPDQGSAASEHSILQEITGPLASLPDDPVGEVVNPEFPVALRGYDRDAVDDYVQRTSQLVAELQATRSPEAAVRRALERVGEQISGILQRAHQTAEEITAQSRREAEDRLEKVRSEAADIEAATRTRIQELDLDTDRIWAERHRIVDDARALSQQLLELAETAAQRFPPAETGGPDDDEHRTTRAPVQTGGHLGMGAGGVPPAGPIEEHPVEGAALGDEGGEAGSVASEPGDEGPGVGEPLEGAPTERIEDVPPGEEPTMAFGTLEDERMVPGEEATPPPGEHRRSVIPPASDAATRRFER